MKLIVHPVHFSLNVTTFQGLPMGAVQNAMQRDGLDPSIAGLDPEKSLACQLENNEALIDKGTPLKDDPTYSKYFKMLKMVRNR